jgi:ribose-phosphate pyrophosphokinase
MAEPDPILLFTGSGSRRLSARIAEHLGIELGMSETRRFSDGNLFVKVQQNVRGRDIF